MVYRMELAVQVLWASVQILVLQYGPQHGTRFELYMKQIPCVLSEHVCMYPHARGCVPMCTWPCIHMQAAMYPHEEFDYAIKLPC
jgi:hypothetical protein